MENEVRISIPLEWYLVNTDWNRTIEAFAEALGMRIDSTGAGLGRRDWVLVKESGLRLVDTP